MGLRVLLLDTKPSNPNHYICLAIFHALQKHPGVEAVYLASFGDAIALAQRHQCNLFFAFDGEGLHIELCQRLKAICGYSLVWNTEDPYELPVNLAHATLFDHIYTNDSASVSAYGDKATHLPLAASKEFQYHPVLENGDCRYDLFFAGTAWPNRVQLIGKLANLMDGSLRMKLAMPTNEHLPAIENLPLAPSVYNWRTSNIEFARFANQSRITLGLHRDFSTTPGAPTAAMTPGPRIFEVAMAGGFQLVDQALAETGQFFALGTELVTFDGEKDCLDKVDYFLRHPNERVAIAKAAQARALESHTYKTRVDQILSALPALKAENSTFSLSQIPQNKHRILFVTHNMLGKNTWGGVEMYQEEMRNALKGDMELYFYAPTGTHQDGIKNYGLYDHHLNLIEEYAVNQAWNLRILSCEERERCFSSVLMKYRIELVHFQHLMLHTPSLPIIASALGVPTIYTWHDYYGACMKFNLVGMYGTYCEIESMPMSGCDACLHQFAMPGSQAIRREFYARMFENVSLIHVSTQEVLDRVKSVYPTLERSKFVIRGIPNKRLPVIVKDHDSNKRMQAVIFGNFSVVKGAGQLLHVLRGLRDFPIDIHIHGRIDVDSVDAVQELDCPNAIFHGGYGPDEIPEILSGKDIAIFSSIWPETYSLALSEVVLAGVIPVAPNIGAFSIRLTHSVNGFLYENRNVGQLISLVRDLIYSPEKRRKVREQLYSISTESIDEHAQWISNIYNQAIYKSPAPKFFEQSEVSIQPIILRDCGIPLNYPTWTEPHHDNIKRIDPPQAPSTITSLPLLKRVWRYYRIHGFLGLAKRVKRIRVRIG